MSASERGESPPSQASEQWQVTYKEAHDAVTMSSMNNMSYKYYVDYPYTIFVFMRSMDHMNNGEGDGGACEEEQHE